MARGREPSPMKLFVETHVQSDDHKKRCSSSLTIELNTLLYIGFQPFSFLCFYFLEFDDFIFYFHETYNSQLKGRYMDDPLTHPNFDLDMWLEVGSSDEPDRNRVYELFNTTVENLQRTHSFLTIECSQSIPVTQFSNFTNLLDQGVQAHTNYLNEKYK